MTRVVKALRIAATFAIMTLGAFVMLAVAMCTCFMARRFYSEVIGAFLARLILRLWGVSYRVHGGVESRYAQTIYISNHTSTLDVFLLLALALPRARFFLSGFLRKMIPIGIIGTIIRIFWTVPQQYPERRREIFKRADRILRETGDSVYCSPEGTRITTGEIGAFNKGGFHLATSLRAQIVPIYFSIPSEINPGMGYDAKPGLVDLYFLPPIDASEWRLADLEPNRDAVRDLFVRVHDAMRRTGRLPKSLDVAPRVVAEQMVTA